MLYLCRPKVLVPKFWSCISKVFFLVFFFGTVPPAGLTCKQLRERLLEYQFLARDQKAKVIDELNGGKLWPVLKFWPSLVPILGQTS